MIGPESRLLQDLGVDGDDAAEFIAKLMKDWNIDVAGFHFDRHFLAEWRIAWWFLPGVRLETKQKVPITVSQIVEAIKTGRLRSPDAER